METTTTVKIVVNGEERSLPEGQSVADLLERLGIDRGRSGTAVAVNWSLVRKAEWEQATLSEGDTVEIVTATQGG